KRGLYGLPLHGRGVYSNYPAQPSRRKPMNVNLIGRALCTASVAVCAALALNVSAALLDTLKDLVSIESGSGDREGLDKISELIAARLRALGGTVEFIEPNPADIYRMVDTPKQI